MNKTTSLPSLNSQLIEYLKARQHQVISYEELYEGIWLVPVYPGYKNILSATISYARLELDDSHLICNVLGRGYIYIETAKKD